MKIKKFIVTKTLRTDKDIISKGSELDVYKENDTMFVRVGKKDIYLSEGIIKGYFEVRRD